MTYFAVCACVCIGVCATVAAIFVGVAQFVGGKMARKHR